MTAIFLSVVCVLCGGNIDTTVLGRVLERGLATDGRICRFVVNVSDRPGGIAELTRLIASIGVRWVAGCMRKTIMEIIENDK